MENAGEYNIEIFTPQGLDGVTEALYEINIKDEFGISEKTIVTANQNINQGTFNSISTIYIPNGYRCSVMLRDVVGTSSNGSHVVFDAIRFTPVSASNVFDANINLADNVLIKSAAPNPFNAQIKIFYQISSAEDVVISIHDNLGKKILQHEKKNHSSGFHTFVWNGKNNLGVDVSSGVYIFSITSSLERKTKKLVYLK